MGQPFECIDSQEAQKNAKSLFEVLSEEEMKQLIRDNPSLRGMLSGFTAEFLFHKAYLRGTTIAGTSIPILSPAYKPDDHDRTENKADYIATLKLLDIAPNVRFQVKSIQTNSIKDQKGGLRATVQNDASDRREVQLPVSGQTINTTCILAGDYDILVVPTFPFTGKVTWAFKLNSACERSSYHAIPEEDRPHVLKTSENITWPLQGGWTDDIEEILELLYREKKAHQSFQKDIIAA